MQVGMTRLFCESARATQFACWGAGMEATCKLLRDNRVGLGEVFPNPKHSTLNTQHTTHNTQHSALNPQPSTHNPQPSTLTPQPSTLNPQVAGAEDELDFEFLASYNNSAFMALHNAAQEKSALDPLPV